MDSRTEATLPRVSLDAVVAPAPLRVPAERAALDAVDYYKKSRSEMLDFLPPGATRLIDIGCGEGLFGAAVKTRYPACETWGVEPIADAAERAATRNDRVIHAPLEDIAELPLAYFDVVTMNDVLEHMTWPEPALALAKRILRPDGRLVLSLPNVRYYRNVSDLLFKNDWEYLDYGILDRTHFRFYTTKSAVRLLEQNGFKVEQVTGINATPIEWYYRLLFAAAPRIFHSMQFPQFAIVARS
jgi:2-polyprenyl-3-methyl-5-hydroxy-6-metoxy-1,4-benzoquinol methylase